MRSLMNEFEREWKGDNRNDYVDTIYVKNKLNIMVQRFESRNKVKYNYDLDKLEKKHGIIF